MYKESSQGQKCNQECVFASGHCCHSPLETQSRHTQRPQPHNLFSLRQTKLSPHMLRGTERSKVRVQWEVPGHFRLQLRERLEVETQHTRQLAAFPSNDCRRDLRSRARVRFLFGQNIVCCTSELLFASSDVLL